MSPMTPSKWDRLNRRGWLLWGAAFVLLLALAASVPILYLPLLERLGSADGTPQWIEDRWIAFVGLIGLVLLFCLYTAFQQRELNRTRSALNREEREKGDVRARLAELSALFQVSTTLNLQLRLEVILEIIVRRVVSTMRAQQASIMIYNPESGALETRASYGLESEYSRHASVKLGEGIAGWVAERREGVLLGENAGGGELGRHYKDNRNISSALSLPMQVGDRIVGVLNVNRINHPEPFEDHHRELVRLFAEHVAAVVERAEMMDRLGSRTRELEADNVRLSEMNRVKDVFLSTASHELKTPLTSVIAYAELLDDNDAKLTREQGREFLHRLRAEADRLMGLIEDILDLSRIEGGKFMLKRAPLSLNEAARSALETSRSVATKHGVELSAELDPDLPETSLDEVKMRQVLVNLIVNAVKFSPQGGHVVMRSRRDGHWVCVEVSDQGPGIEPDATTHIFELFGQGFRQGEDRKGGLGIGLHLVKRITEMHGGHVGVNSRPGEGSTFWVRLPVIEHRVGTVDLEPRQAA